MPHPRAEPRAKRASRLPALVAGLALLPALAGGGYDSRRIGWSELHYRASKLGFSLESRVRLGRLSRSQLASALDDPRPGDWLPAPEDGGWRLELETEGLGRRSRLELLIDTEGRSLQRTQVETGRRRKDNHDRTQRFSPTAIHIDTRKPARGEVEAAPTEWSERSEWLFELSDPLPRGAHLGQSTGLFYTLAAADLSHPGDRVVSHVLSKGRVSEVELVVEARERIDADFVEEGASGPRRRRGPVETLRVRVSGRTLGPEPGRSDFRFLGLRGDLRVYLDAASRAPVLITGDTGWLGEARIRLERLVSGSH